MAKDNKATVHATMIVHPLQKFCIGLFGGVCAAFIPRLGGMLTTDTSRLTILPLEFIISGLLFGVLIGGVMVIMANLLVDILYAWIDPRIRYES